MKDINLRDVNYDDDAKGVGHQIAQEIKDAGYSFELSHAIKMFESGNANAMEKAYEALYDFAEAKGIEVKANRKTVRMSKAIVDVANKLEKQSGVAGDLRSIAKKYGMDQLAAEFSALCFKQADEAENLKLNRAFDKAGYALWELADAQHYPIN